MVEALESAGHSLHSKNIIKDDVYDLRALVSAHIADPKVNAILTTGGTGFTARDNTQKALQPLLICILTGSVNYSDSYRTKKSGTLLCSQSFCRLGQWNDNFLSAGFAQALVGQVGLRS